MNKSVIVVFVCLAIFFLMGFIAGHITSIYYFDEKLEELGCLEPTNSFTVSNTEYFANRWKYTQEVNICFGSGDSESCDLWIIECTYNEPSSIHYPLIEKGVER